MRIISDFKRIPKRGRLLDSDGLESNEVNTIVDVGPDWEPVEWRCTTEIFRGTCDTGGLG